MRFLIIFLLYLIVIVNLLSLWKSWRRRSRSGKRSGSDESTFLRSAFSMLALMAKADGRVSEREISVLENYMLSVLRLDEWRRKQAIDAFRQALSSDRTFEDHARDFYERFHRNPALVFSMAGVLSELARADGGVSPAEETLLDRAILIFGLRRERFARREETVSTSPDPLDEACRVLGCARDASPQEIKRCYRRLAKENHPDRVLARGLPPEFAHHAEERFKQIQEAYDAIMR